MTSPRPTRPVPRMRIHVQPLAPAKPALGAACNGCGVCCLLEPCPLGMLLSGKRRGACAALQWAEGEARYRCAAVVQPEQLLLQRWPGLWRGLRQPMASVLRRWARRWIAAGSGCDCSDEVETPPNA